MNATYHTLTTFPVTKSDAVVSTNNTDRVEIKIGVLLPTALLINNQSVNNSIANDNVMAGIQLAVDEINHSNMIPGAHLTVVQKEPPFIQTTSPLQQQSYQQISSAVTQAVIIPTLSLMQEDGVVGIISGDSIDSASTDWLSTSSWTTLSALLTSSLQIPHCSFSATALSLSDKSQYGTFFRTVPTGLSHIDAITSFIQSQNWTTFGILYSDTDGLGRLMTQVLSSKCKQKSSPLSLISYQALTSSKSTTAFNKAIVKEEQTTMNYNLQHIHQAIDHIMSLGARTIVIATEDLELTATTLMMAVLHKHLNKDTAWLIVIADDEKTNTSNHQGSTPVLQQRLEELVNRYNQIIQLRILMNNNTQPAMAMKSSPIAIRMWNNNDNSTTNSSLLLSTSKSNGSGIESLAWDAGDLTPLDYSTLFPGGVFAFQATRKDLDGYPPFNKFKDMYQKRFSIEQPDYYRSGLAYSCLMTMAQALGQIVLDAANPTETLKKLTAGGNKRGESFLSNFDMITLFNNTGIVGPQGPVVLNKEGDITTGNFKIFNLQNGSQVEIGRIVGGDFELSSSPIYYDGTHVPPVGKPPITVLETGLTTPISKITASVTVIGMLVASFMLCTLIVKRQHPVFKSASVPFCIMELIGFLLSYASILLIFKGSMCLATCYLKPISFYLAYTILICTMLARNYKVYKTMNNVFAKEVFMSDFELLRVISYVFSLNTSVLVLWLASTNVELSEVSLGSSNTVFIKTCNYYHDPSKDERQHENYFDHSFLVVILSILAGIELGICVFMTMRTKSFGGYSKYSEHKQLGLSVYNIFFSSMIGFIIFFMPTNDFYTRHYTTAMTILWATTFSMVILFFPKLFKLIRGYYNSKAVPLGRKNKVHHYQWKEKERQDPYARQGSSGYYTSRKGQISAKKFRDEEDKTLMTMNQFLATDEALLSMRDEVSDGEIECIDDNTTMRSVTMVGSSNTINLKANDVEYVKRISTHQRDSMLKEKCYVYWFEDTLPVQKVVRFFPSFLARWEMQRLVLYPQFSLILYYSSENGSKGDIQFNYTHASIVAKTDGDYVFKIHSSRGFYDLLVQVGTEAELHDWCFWLNNNTAENKASSIGQSPVEPHTYNS